MIVRFYYTVIDYRELNYEKVILLNERIESV